jgi:DNA-binding SARP family transcriptional activator
LTGQLTEWNAAPFQIRLLGTPLVTWQGQQYRLCRRQGRALLYYLAAEGRPVPRECLAFLLWPNTPEAEARRKLTRVLSQLHCDLPAAELLQVDRLTANLNWSRVWTDVAAFEAWLAEAAPDGEERAIALYRGRFLAGFALPDSPEYEQWLAEQSHYYENRYLSILAQWLQERADCGDYPAAIRAAHKYLAIDELAEEVHGRLIRLYTATHNRAAALRQYESCALVLERELGVEPLPETRAAYEAALLGERETNGNRVVKLQWAIIPSLQLPLAGREAAWQALGSAHERYRNGGLILLQGEAGIGKSRLMQEFATRQARLVLTGNCQATTRTLPYQPVVQALRQALALPELWAGIRPIWLAEAARLLPELPETFPHLPAPVEVKPDQAQARLCEALCQCFLGLAAQAPLLLCLDDLHWADEATRGWLAALAAKLAGSRLCLLAACRLEEAAVVADVKETFSRRSLLAEVSLSGLSAAAVRELLGRLPQPLPEPGALANRIARATAGNPFFALETIRTLLERDLLACPDGELPLPRTVQEAVQERLARLSPVAKQVLESAAVLSPDLQFDLIQQTAGRSELEVTDGLDELVRRQLLVEGEQHLFKHDLLAQVAYQHLSPGRRRLLHRRAAEAFGRVCLARPDGVAAQMARHYELAGEAAAAVPYFTRAGLVAQRRCAHDEAVANLNRALSQAEAFSLAPQEVARLQELLGDSLAAKRYCEAALQTFSRCLEQVPGENCLKWVEPMQKTA